MFNMTGFFYLGLHLVLTPGLWVTFFGLRRVCRDVIDLALVLRSLIQSFCVSDCERRTHVQADACEDNVDGVVVAI